MPLSSNTHSIIPLIPDFGLHLFTLSTPLPLWIFKKTIHLIPKPDLATSAPNIISLRVTFSTSLPQKAIRRFVTSQSSKRWAIHSTAQIENIALSNEDRQTWEACRQALSAFSFSMDEQDKILGKAFGHVHSPYWGEERKKEVPKYEIVNEILDYLRSLSLSDDDIYKLLKKFPEVLGCSIEHELRTNVQILEKDWGIKGKSLKSLLLRNPKVLGYNIDCKGDCMAQCTRCWVRF
ncbi:Mitochodrial transcription termination factor-related protein [Corchorus olitorius]|uniref:Mitochodrial transcription termination factor-related protein n=1 Tax=Corchorus olitorius TaxID=93759 RepID=A0A1R3IKL1_9ROSI|nr:Mitochodrial transcription termination factor-related protein [Corchorus olitorius]